ncbi:MAG: hypothetical protein K5662_02035 [Lachnospiraceae bacterium]|nr:hypothetical protein [Lachnospiraceae bacterium]
MEKLKVKIKEMLNILKAMMTGGMDKKYIDEHRDQIFKLETILGSVMLICLTIMAICLYKDRYVYSRGGGSYTDNDQSYMLTEEPDIVDSMDEENAPDQEVTEYDLSGQIKPERVEEIGELPDKYVAGQMLEYKGDDYQLPELYSYWDSYSLDAVNEIIRLERFRVITDALAGTDDFYYYGDTGRDGRPEGRGLAVYANNTYYFGSWDKGKRDGDGMWLRIFPNNDGIVGGVRGVESHMYNGSWAGDYPNGRGQENIIYSDKSSIEQEYVIQNAIGEFKNGYYNGDMYLQMLYNGSVSIDWYGTCDKGTFLYISEKENSMGKRPVMVAGEGQETIEEDNCFWMLPADNSDHGVAGLK